ncbi:MAG: ribonuclease HI family protein [Candidatus Falkowbacteria bacterium]|nr:ribonuclease HI family protein [Candidatus Falkowbacteria bacterium]
MKYKKLIIHTDGGARGNPGPAGIGVVVYDEEKQVVAEISRYLGKTTNNQAEYQAVLAGIHKAKDLGATEVVFYLDSELVAKQLNREYKVKNKELAPWFVKIYNATLDFKKVIFKHIPRTENNLADKLANEAMDRGK